MWRHVFPQILGKLLRHCTRLSPAIHRPILFRIWVCDWRRLIVSRWKSRLCVQNSSVVKIYIIRPKPGSVAKNATPRPFGWESNPRPLDYQTNALPLSYRSRCRLVARRWLLRVARRQETGGNVNLIFPREPTSVFEVLPGFLQIFQLCLGCDLTLIYSIMEPKGIQNIGNTCFGKLVVCLGRCSAPKLPVLQSNRNIKRSVYCQYG